VTASNAAKPIQIKLLLVRHGATSGNAEKRYIGKTDEPLSEAGRETLRDFVAAGRYSVFSDDVTGTAGKNACLGKSSSCSADCATKRPCVPLVFVSPMKRCVETAQILFPDVKPVVNENFRETDFGLFEGKNYDELMADDRLRSEYQKWIDSGGKDAFPGGESREAFIERTMQGFMSMMDLVLENCAECNCADVSGECHDVVAECENPGFDVKNDEAMPPAVAVIHGGSIMAILSALCGGSFYDYQVENGGGYVCTARIEPADSESVPKEWESARKGCASMNIQLFGLRRL